MNWTSLDQFLHMGGYGLYVWGSYGAALAVMLTEAALVRRRLHAARAALGDVLGDREASR
jgi:heme exporter protein D